MRLKRVEPGVEAGKKVVKIPIQNYQPKVMKDLTAKASFAKKGSDKVIKKRELETLEFAPNSSFQLDLAFPPNDVESGKYIATIEVNDGEKKWEWQEEFEVTEGQAKKMNKEAVFKLTIAPWVKWTSIVLLAVLVLLTAFLYVRKTKWQKRLQER